MVLYIGNTHTDILRNNMDEQDLVNIFNLEVARELLLEENPSITDEEVNNVWGNCGNNPWNAPIVYKLMRITKHG
jgi:hypothetical protein